MHSATGFAPFELVFGHTNPEISTSKEIFAVQNHKGKLTKTKTNVKSYRSGEVRANKKSRTNCLLEIRNIK